MSHARDRFARPVRQRGNFNGLDATGFGTYSTFWQRECPVPEVGLMPLPLNHAVSNAWCDCVFGGTDTYDACVDTKYVFYPWTALGKLERGWSWEFTDFIPKAIPGGGGSGTGGGGGGSGGVPGGYQPAPAASGSAMTIGGGLLLAAYLLLK
jgi:hypothetical protein